MDDKKGEINERIKAFIEYKGLTTKEFAKKIDGNEGTLSNILGGRKSAPGYDLINKIALSFDDLDTKWLITGLGQMIKEDEHKGISSIDETIDYIIKHAEELEKTNRNFYLWLDNVRLRAKFEELKKRVEQ